MSVERPLGCVRDFQKTVEGPDKAEALLTDAKIVDYYERGSPRYLL